jgi:hypothetical protein
VYFIGFFILLLFFQYTTTNIKPLNYLSSPEKSLVLARINEYPLIYINLDNHRLYLPLAHNLEEKNLAVISRALEKNFFNTISINTYFFAGHPFEGNFTQHFESFSFLTIPFLLVGFFTTKWFKNKILLVSLICPLLLLTIIGNDNTLGAFSLFPFFIILMTRGADKTVTHYKRN